MEGSLKLTIDTKQQRVLFAEADKAFVDFIFSFLDTQLAAGVGRKGFVKGGVVKYMVLDDLFVTQFDSPSSIINLLKRMNVNSLDGVEERLVHVTKDQAQMIFELNLISSSGTILTDVFLAEEAAESDAKK